ncbi:hypothetical protein AB0K74_29235 [Streptomyces sp. NPDC056159]|uniref:hypothetical protein n=1 Tax=unclassified Streptomyces TaxID=2593676 RepID=UPI003428C081
MWVLPSVREFDDRETDPATGMEFRLKRALRGLRDLVDVLFLDVPAWAGGKIVGFALTATRKALIPAPHPTTVGPVLPRP